MLLASKADEPNLRELTPNKIPAKTKNLSNMEKLTLQSDQVQLDNIASKNRIFFSDNLKILKYLTKVPQVCGHVKLIYIDPPFATKQKFRDRKLRLAYTDTLDGDKFLDFLRPRLKLLRELLAIDGSLFLHCDWHMSHYLKILCDEIFDRKNFRNEIVVRRGRKKNLQKQFSKVHRLHVDHDVILWYSRNPQTKYPPVYVPKVSEAKWMGFWSNIDRPTMRYPLLGVKPDRGQWKWARNRALVAVKNYETFQKLETSLSLTAYWKESGKTKEFIRKQPSRKYPEYWIPPQENTLIGTNWTDIMSYSYSSRFPTEKHQQLLERIISNFSKPQDLVLDCFGGSGTSAVVCQGLKRRWILVDNSWLAIKTTIKRLKSTEGDPWSLTYLDESPA